MIIMFIGFLFLVQLCNAVSGDLTEEKKQQVEFIILIEEIKVAYI